MNYISELQEIVDTIGVSRMSQVVKKNIPLFEFVQQHHGESISEKIYNALHPGENTCARGNVKKFNTFTYGYRFCKSQCACMKESVSEKVIAAKQAMTEDDIQSSNAKRVSTNLEKHGVTNARHTENSRIAHAAKYENREQVDAINDRIRATKLERYGSETYNNPEKIGASLREKTIEDWEKKFNNKNLHILREADALQEYYDEFTVAQIADLLDVHVGTVRTYIRHHALVDTKEKVYRSRSPRKPAKIVDLSHCMIDSKYKKWYYAIIAKASVRTERTAYTERHHIIPVSLGGSNFKENLVDLTGREHFICHWLLTKFCIGAARPKMLSAMYMMQAKNKHQYRYVNSRVYAHIREEFSQIMSKKFTGRIVTPEQRAKIGNANRGKKYPPRSKEFREARTGSKHPMFGKKHSEESKAKMSASSTGKVHSKESVARAAAALRAKGYKRERKICEHCGKDVAVNGYARYHGDRCKMKK